MKKTTKIILIIAGISVALGLVISIVAAAAGGTTIAKEVVFGNGLPSLFVKMDQDKDDFGIYFGGASSEEQTLSWSKDEIKNLDLEYEAGLVEIVEGDDDVMIKVVYRGKNTISLEGNTLTINSTEKDIVDAKGVVRVEVPNGFAFENVDIQTGATQTNIEMLHAKNFELEMGAGAGNIENITCDDMNIEIAAGEVVVENGDTKDASVDVGMGNFEYAGKIQKDLDINCGMGNAYIELEDEETMHNYKVECGAGNISVGDTSYSGLAAVKTIEHENATSDFVLKCGMGNIEVAFE